jgi:sigma-B regulation protein RsbU (phosphoserine phosphatase)
MNMANELYTDHRLLDTMNTVGDQPLPAILNAVKQSIETFADGAEQADDITMLLLKYGGSGAPDELVVKAESENLTRVQEFVSGRLSDCADALRNKIGIVVDEIFANICSYAYEHPVGDAAVRVTAAEDIVIEFKDSGVAFNPLDTEDPDVTLPEDQRQIGGLGIFMVKNIMDSVEYRREGAKNILTVKKKMK